MEAKSCGYVGGKRPIQEVSWKELHGVKIDGRNLVKIGGEGWNAAATSAQYLGGDGAIEFMVSNVDQALMFGLSHDNPDVRYETIDHAVFLTTYGEIKVYEAGLYVGDYGMYQQFDIFSVERKDDQIFYKKNDAIFYISKKEAHDRLFVDTSLFSENASVSDIVLYGSAEFDTNVDWSEMVRSAVDGNKLKNSNGRGWRSGAVSSQVIRGDGAAEFTINKNNKTAVFGLSRENRNTSFKTIDFAIYTASNGYVYVFENGFNKGALGKYNDGDMFRIERQGTKIVYLQNCEPIYTSKRKSKGTLIVDVSLYSRSAEIVDAKVLGQIL
ncbi:MAG: hypothetical protein ACE5EH_11240 [Gammaproteobacteria bacterium]